MTTRKTGPAPRRSSLLVELGVEELPPAMLKTLAEAFAAGFVRQLTEAGVVDNQQVDDPQANNQQAKNQQAGNQPGNNQPGNYRYFATPRRLAVLVNAVAARQPDRVSERRGPSLQAARDERGRPSRAAEGFAKSCGVSVAQLDTLENDKGAWLVYRHKVAGANLAAIVTDCLEQSVRQLPMPKRMRWGEGRARFVRPLRWLLVLHGANLVKTEVLGLKAERFTRGHRFHAGGKLAVAGADEYAEVLESDGNVIADFERRRAVIKTQIERLANQADARLVADDDLLELVTGMVEWPHALLGGFERRFLKIPPEVLVSSMRDHQKYFHLVDGKGKLLPAFIAVSNLNSNSPARVLRGNERVLRARLADAEFFWNNDLKIPLEARVEDLRGVLFHHKLGSFHDKAARVVQLAELIAEQLKADVGMAGRAALLCKADLVTDMVGEFPELQGTIGRYYAQKAGAQKTGAQKAGEDKQVADAIEQHYWPRRRFDKYGGDKLPRSAVAQSVALADRLDSLTGMFAGGEIPSGDKDPFALRRAALGVLRILIEKQLDLDLCQLLQASRESYQNSGGAAVTPDAETVEQVFGFMLERLKAYYQPMGYSAAELAAVMACRPSKPLDFDRRLKALSRFFKNRPEAADSLAAANKRIARILSKAGLSESELNKASPEPPQYDESLFRHKAETELARQLDKIGARARACFSDNRYDSGFVALSALRQPVDSFFDEVLVMDEDAALRKNRLALLHCIRRLFLGVADISFMGTDR